MKADPSRQSNDFDDANHGSQHSFSSGAELRGTHLVISMMHSIDVSFRTRNAAGRIYDRDNYWRQRGYRSWGSKKLE